MNIKNWSTPVDIKIAILLTVFLLGCESTGVFGWSFKKRTTDRTNPEIVYDAFSGSAVLGYFTTGAEIGEKINSLGYHTRISYYLTKIKAIAQAPNKKVWYSLSHGKDGNLDFHGIVTPTDFSNLGLDYILVYLSACYSYTAKEAWKTVFKADAFVGYQGPADKGLAVGFDKEFFSHLTEHKTVSDAFGAAWQKYRNTGLFDDGNGQPDYDGGNIVVQK